jgi:outer membrane translocation and assembly module TamA
MGSAGALTAQDGEPAAPDSTPGTSSTLLPLPAIFYTPETGTAFGAALAYFWYPDPLAQPDRQVQPSSLSLLGVYTTKKQIIVNAMADLAVGETHRVKGVLDYLKFPTKFWGIGNDTPESAEEDYTPRTVMLNGEYLWEARRGWRFGGTVQAGYRTLTELDPDGQLVQGTVPGSEDGWVAGMGVLASRDTRPSTVYPRSGMWLQLRAQWHGGLVGSDFDFVSVAADARGYTSVGGAHVFAARVLAQAVTGTAPFDLLPQLGGDMLLRGYYQGRYRDRTLAAAQVEYRSPFIWRVGIVGFAAAGQVGPSFGAMGFDRFKPAVGAGVRFRFVEATGLSIRADYGWGLDGGVTGFYLNVGEAF